MALNNISPSCDLNSPDMKCKVEKLNIINSNYNNLKEWCNMDRDKLVRSVLNQSNKVDKTNMKYSRENKLHDGTYNLDDLFPPTMCESLCETGCNTDCRRANCWSRPKGPRNEVASNNVTDVVNNALATIGPNNVSNNNDPMNASMNAAMNNNLANNAAPVNN